MALTQLDDEISLNQSCLYSHEQVNEEIARTQSRFDRILRKYFLFQGMFLTLIVAEIVLLFFFFGTLSQSSLVSMTLSGFFLTLFGYFILSVYWQTSKDQRVSGLRIEFFEKLKLILEYKEEVPESHILMASAFCRMAESLMGREYTYYTPPKWLGFMSTVMEKLSFWGHWKDCHSLKEMVLNAAVEEHIKLVKCEPTNPDTHTALANAYILLTDLYACSHRFDEGESNWGPSKKEFEIMERKFKISAQRAIEELKILSIFFPNDLWVHEQLAYSYRDLKMPVEEIQEYELILQLVPNNVEILYKLGVLYFEQGKNAQGLQLYERLKHLHFKKAELLIKHYGAYRY